MAGNYVRTGPFVNGGAPGIAAAFLNNLEAVLERNSGDTEQGHYFLSGWSNASGDLLQVYIVALSRTSVPISVSIDQSDKAPTNVATPSTGQLTSGGFQIYTTSTSAQVTNLQVGGLYTIQW